MDQVSPPPPTRAYRSALRAEQARATRRRVLVAATALFLESGYAATTVRAVAGRSGASVPTVEALFGTKARLLKAAIDVAIAGDDEPVPMLDRDWAQEGLRAPDVRSLLRIAARVLGAAQERSAGLVLAAFEGAGSDPELAALAGRLVEQRAGSAAWLVDVVRRLSPLREETRHPADAAGRAAAREAAVDTVWLLLDPAVYERFTRRLGHRRADYEDWIARTIEHALVPDSPPSTHPTTRSSS